MEPIPAAGVLVYCEPNEVLLVRHTDAAGHRTGLVNLPAGRVEPGERAVDAAVRELAEETGLRTTVDALVRVPNEYGSRIERKEGVREYVLTVFVAQRWEGMLRASEETEPFFARIDRIGTYECLPDLEAIVRDGLAYRPHMRLAER